MPAVIHGFLLHSLPIHDQRTFPLMVLAMWFAVILTVALLETMPLSSSEPGKVSFLVVHQHINSSYSALNASTNRKSRL